MSRPHSLLAKCRTNTKWACVLRPFSSGARCRSTHTDDVRIVEVGPRDGLQNEKTSILLETKLELIRRLSSTGVRTMEAGSFVAPKWVPQMANSDEVLRHLLRSQSSSSAPIDFNFLIPNAKGLDNLFEAMGTNPEQQATEELNGQVARSGGNKVEISVFTAATEAFSKINTNCTIDESLRRCEPLVSKAKSENMRVRGYISVALGCPYEGPDVSPLRVAEMTRALLAMGVDEVSVADTTGMGTAPKTRELLKAIFGAGVAPNDLALHFHDTYGQALVNVLVGLEHGIRTFDSSVGGLGGCPFSKGATGNVATEDLIHLFHSLGLRTGISLNKMAEIGDWISKELNRNNDSRTGKAVLARLSAGVEK